METNLRKTPIVSSSLYIQETKHDKINSRLVVAVYHQKGWNSSKGAINVTYHSMKFMQESQEYMAKPLEVEFGRIPRIIRSKKAKFSNNPITTIICYENLNKGRTLKDVENTQVFKAVVSNNQIGNNYQIDIKDQAWHDFIYQILVQINNEL